MKSGSIVFILPILILGGCAQPAEDPGATEAIARCTYVNAFSDDLECKEYLGSNWSIETIEDNCAAPVPGSDPGVVELGVACGRAAVLGQCVVDPGTVEAATIVFPAGPGASCDGLAVGCSFAGGTYEPAAACGGADPTQLPPSDREPFRPFERVCVDPLPGTPSGDGAGGQVCTWEAISASTEAGRHYADYASCEPVVKQRPYWAADAVADTPDGDPRYADKAWLREADWVTSQIEASACICCHTTAHSPEAGPSGWYLEADGLWVDTLDDDGLAMMAGWIGSTAFGAFDPAVNNGFDRSLTGTASTDPPRMKAFFEGELARRGFSEADFADDAPFGGPLADQLAFTPARCADGLGVIDGRVRWQGGPARYVYVMEAEAAPPGVPPNLDLPDGTLWRLDVAPDDAPVASDVRYGDAPDGATQAFPAGGAAPEALRPGWTYALYALADVYVPLTRCTFVAR